MQTLSPQATKTNQPLSGATQTLLKRRAQLQVEMPKLRSRDQAKALGISELECITLDVGEHVTMLRQDFKALLLRLEGIGKMMALTRNESVVHERKGIYSNISFYEGHMQMGVAVNPDIDLRLFMGRWKYGIAITLDRGPKRSKLFGFQFFDAFGIAVHKIYTTPASNLDIYHSIVADFKAEKQTRIELEDREHPTAPQEKPDEAININGFRESWNGLKDTHDFFPLLKKYGVSRPQALRLAPPDKVIEVPKSAVEAALEAARDTQTSIMCFVHSFGCIQIHTGTVNRLAWHGPWYNIMDPEFNLHLNMDAVSKVFIVRKPTSDGIVTSLELYSEAGELLVYFFGERKPGKPELAAWRGITEQLTSRKA